MYYIALFLIRVSTGGLLSVSYIIYLRRTNGTRHTEPCQIKHLALPIHNPMQRHVWYDLERCAGATLRVAAEPVSRPALCRTGVRIRKLYIHIT